MRILLVCKARKINILKVIVNHKITLLHKINLQHIQILNQFKQKIM